MGKSTDKNDRSLTLDEIFKAKDCELERIDVPEWGGHVFLKRITGREFDDMADEGKREGAPAFGVRLLRRSMVNEDGERLLQHQSDVDRMLEKSAAVLTRLIDEAFALNGIGAKAGE